MTPNLYDYREDDWYTQGINALVDFGAELHKRGLGHAVINTVFGTYTAHPRDTTDYKAMWLAHLRKEPFNPVQTRALADLLREAMHGPVPVIAVGDDL